LGFGRIIFGVEDNKSGLFVTCHTIDYTNTSTASSIDQPDFRVAVLATNAAATAENKIIVGSAAMFVEGDIARFDPHFATSNTHETITTATTNVVLLKIRNPCTFNEILNNSSIVLETFTVIGARSGKDTRAVTTMNIVSGGSPSDHLDQTYVNKDNSIAIQSQPAVGTTLTGGIVIFTTGLTSESVQTINLLPYDIQIPPNEDIFITYSNNTPAQGNIDVGVALVWVEEQ
jgi:hypothetical protein